MEKLPLLEKNAYLKIRIKKDNAVAHLAYSHYDVGRSYILKDLTSGLNPENIGEYLATLQSEFDWEIFHLVDSANFILDFSDEGIGISGITVILDDTTYVKAIRDFCPEIKIEINSKKLVSDRMTAFCRKLGYKDLLVIDSDILSTTITRARYALEDSLKNNYSVQDAYISDNDIDVLASSILSAQLQAFMTDNATIYALANRWVNYVYTGIEETEDNCLLDILRAQKTRQLLSLSLANKELLKDFGKQSRAQKNLQGIAIIFTGSMARVINEKSIIVSLIDGLQLSGHFDLYVDKNNFFDTMVSSYLDGINASDIILSRKDVLEDPIKVILPEIQKDKSVRKVVMDGNVISQERGEVRIYALAPNITLIDTPNEKAFVSMKLSRGAYLKGYGEELEFSSDPLSTKYSKIIVDCRYKPIIYGPDRSINKNNFDLWFNEQD
ncbi:MAG TPA: hypothetical protein PKJ86_00435 [Candidatus Dojkabacteria bacterium]|nr:hypothetical protein [Candidatus Dojkabacteria bacterium]